MCWTAAGLSNDVMEVIYFFFIINKARYHVYAEQKWQIIIKQLKHVFVAK